MAAAGVRSAAAEVRVAEVHDCFTVTEVINYEDLGFCDPQPLERLAAPFTA